MLGDLTKRSARHEAMVNTHGDETVARPLGTQATVNDPELVAAERIAALQHSLSEVFADPSPLAALVVRLGQVTRSSVALIDHDGKLIEATGPLPLALVQRGMNSESRPGTVEFAAEGWSCLATVIHDLNDLAIPDEWLVAASRRTGFPTVYDRAALGIGAALGVAIHRSAAAELLQARAVRASVLEETLALRTRRYDAELAARAAGLGLRFDGDLRVFVVAPTPAGGRRPVAPTAATLFDDVPRALRAAGITELSSVRHNELITLAQCSPATARRVLIATNTAAHIRVGVGRNVTSIGVVADSFNDATLALRIAARGHTGTSNWITYEDFDVATRLFADVGLNRMAAWAVEFLAPIEGRDALMTGLQTYFSTGQSIKAAAHQLGVHHNSVRYRLAKVEELLGIDLTEPAAIASVFLALTALDLAGPTNPPANPRSRRKVQDTESADAATGFPPPDSARFGAASEPERRHLPGRD